MLKKVWNCKNCWTFLDFLLRFFVSRIVAKFCSCRDVPVFLLNSRILVTLQILVMSLNPRRFFFGLFAFFYFFRTLKISEFSQFSRALVKFQNSCTVSEFQKNSQIFAPLENSCSCPGFLEIFSILFFFLQNSRILVPFQDVTRILEFPNNSVTCKSSCNIPEFLLLSRILVKSRNSCTVV